MHDTEHKLLPGGIYDESTTDPKAIEKLNKKKSLEKITDKIIGGVLGGIQGLILGPIATPCKHIAAIINNNHHQPDSHQREIYKDIKAGYRAVLGLVTGPIEGLIRGAKHGLEGGVKAGALTAKELFRFTATTADIKN